MCFLQWLQRPDSNTLSCALREEDFALSIWFGHYKQFSRSLWYVFDLIITKEFFHLSATYKKIFHGIWNLQGVPYVLGRIFKSIRPIILAFWIYLIKYAKKQSFQWLVWCKLLFCSCTFIKDTGENVQYHFATFLYNLVSQIISVIQTYEKSINDQKWDINWRLWHWFQFWISKT